jgi:DNA-binding response OmpR family regulator
MRGRLLLVEDDSSLNSRFARSLRRFHLVDQVTSLSGAYSHLAESRAPYDVVVLDRVLPDGDGLELLDFVRRDNPETKVCVTSTKDALAEKLHGLQGGADAYLPKPVHPEELAAQVGALLRRGLACTPADEMAYGELRLNVAARCLRRGLEAIRLSPRDTQLMRLFILNQGRVTRDQLYTFYWRLTDDPTESIIHVSIQRLRHRLCQLDVNLCAIYGLGYEITV